VLRNVLRRKGIRHRLPDNPGVEDLKKLDMAILDARAHKALEGGPSFSLGHRLYRALWALSWFTLAAWTPPPLHAWRRLLLRVFGAKLASGARVYASARVWYPPNLTMDAFACLGPRVICYCMAPIRLGEYAIASQGSHLCAGTHDIRDPHFQLIARPIAIGARAWIAAEAFVGPGVTVGDGAVLGARAVAMRDLDPWTLYGGHPAQSLGPRVRRDP
jgi:putative colanic acid biosynthesis acetyltransferase WcaF